jgi:hypothetical protein
MVIQSTCVDGTLESRGLSAGEKLAPRQVKEGTLDLTAAVLFARNSNLHNDIVKICESVQMDLQGPNGPVIFSSVISMLLKDITSFSVTVT